MASATKKRKVKMFTTPTCVYCTLAKQFFKENKIDFEEVDVAKDRSAAEEMIEKSGQMGVPVIEVDGKTIVGFNKPALKQALGL